LLKKGANIIASAKIMSAAFVREQTKCAKFRWTLIGISVPKVTKWRQIERYIILVKCGLLKEKEKHVIHEIYEKFVITRDRRISCLLSFKV